MNSEFNIPDDAVAYILLQRTETQNWLKSIRYNIPYGRSIHNFLYNKFLYQWEAKIRNQQIKRQYINHLSDEFQGVRSFLPESPDNILNIGCGIGGMNIFLDDYYKESGPEFHLYDKSEKSSYVYYQFHHDASYYNSLDLAQRTLAENGVSADRVHPMDVEEHDLQEVGNVDLCVSFLSWGFHYPVDTYIKQVQSVLSPEGSLIMDLRRGTDGLDDALPAFERYTLIESTDKYKRVKFTNPLAYSSDRDERKMG